MPLDVLRRLWERSARRLVERLDGLTDAEFFWAPVPDCWTVRDIGGRWEIDYDWPPPSPLPFTTIAWRLVHLANGNWIYWEHAFGAGARNFPDLEVPSTAAGAIRDWQDSRIEITSWLAGVQPGDLDEPRPSHLGGYKTAGEVLEILIDEQTHHAAEIALLRDLYLRR